MFSSSFVFNLRLFKKSNSERGSDEGGNGEWRTSEGGSGEGCSKICMHLGGGIVPMKTWGVTWDFLRKTILRVGWGWRLQDLVYNLQVSQKLGVKEGTYTPAHNVECNQ